MLAYLDHAATTPMRAEAFEAMVPWLTTSFGNASGGHRVARAARAAVDDAREQVAALVGCEPGEVVFTSGGTEADNLAVAGVAGPAVCSAIEHPAVLAAVHASGGRTVGVDADGRLDLDRLTAALSGDVGLVSVMLANNEVGVVQDLEAVADAVADCDAGIALHTDAVQAAPWLDLRVRARRAQLISVAAHKFGGPQGVGALVVRRGVRLTPLLKGGGQERDRRSGTHNVAGIVGMAAALAAAATDRDVTGPRIAAQRDRLVTELRRRVEGVTVSAAGAARLPNIAHLRIAGVENEPLLVLLDDAGVCVSGGASCASGAMEPSHVLAAMGCSRAEAHTAIRVSLGRPTTDDEIDFALDQVEAAVARLRAHTAVTA